LSTFSTRRRTGFNQPRQDIADLGVYRLPAVVEASDDTADRVLQVLGAIGIVAGNVEAANRQQSAAEDAQMEGIANELYASRADLLASRISNDPNLPVDDEGLSGYVQGLVEQEVASSGFQDNAAASRAFRTRMMGSLMGVATGSRDARVQKVRKDALLDASAAYPTAADPGTIDAALREIDPNISESAIQAYRANAAEAAAITGYADSVARLLTTDDEPPAVAAIRGRVAACARHGADVRPRADRRRRARHSDVGALEDQPDFVLRELHCEPLGLGEDEGSKQGRAVAWRGSYVDRAGHFGHPALPQRKDVLHNLGAAGIVLDVDAGEGFLAQLARIKRDHFRLGFGHIILAG
jgi:hypothetical protein